MSIHIGSIIQEEVERKRFTYKEFGALIHKNEKTIPDIYNRESMSTELLITISEALKIDFFSIYYTEEPLKSLRNDQVAQLNSQIDRFKEQVQRLSEQVKFFQIELSLTKDLNQAQKEIISFAKAQIEDYKLKLAGISHC